jgi:hypothetical protein
MDLLEKCAQLGSEVEALMHHNMILGAELTQEVLQH